MSEADGSKCVLDPDTLRVFLGPKTDFRRQISMNEARPRDLGWIDVRPGQFSEASGKASLLLSEIHAEDFDVEQVHPERYLRWLKRELRQSKQLSFGVLGKNLVTGGQSFYRDIGYTAGAKRLFTLGATWQQFPNDRVVFLPQETRNRGAASKV